MNIFAIFAALITTNNNHENKFQNRGISKGVSPYPHRQNFFRVTKAILGNLQDAKTDETDSSRVQISQGWRVYKAGLWHLNGKSNQPPYQRHRQETQPCAYHLFWHAETGISLLQRGKPNTCLSMITNIKRASAYAKYIGNEVFLVSADRYSSHIWAFDKAESREKVETLGGMSVVKTDKATHYKRGNLEITIPNKIF